ncbi:30S ribosomal protein S3 [Candidatus Woesearchaeota archaeon]|jgi:small subunit ribosomal protein S3|nr:30S ribosomal protein S3 [Candidatus Woesearchaeota archaeon]
MGKKINPKIFRIGQTRTWDSRWFSDRNYSKFLKQDIEIKEFIKEKLKNAFVSRVEVERTSKDINIIINSARPGVIIGRGGVGVEDMKKEIGRRFLKDRKIGVNLTIKEVANVNLDSMIIALALKFDIEKRIPFRRSMKQAIQKVERAGAKGIKVSVSGRLNGAEIARSEKLISGKVPLHTIRADVDYAFVEANTIYGVIGIKVWIYRGDIFNKKNEKKGNK